MTNNVEAIKTLPDPLHGLVTEAFSLSLHDTFLAAVPLTVLAVVVALFLKEIPLLGRQVPQAPAEGDASRRGLEESRDHTEHRGLAGAVRSEQRHGLARRDVQPDGDVTRRHGRVVLERVHRAPCPPRTARLVAGAITSTATTMRTRDRATAASGSVNRSR